ncbi:hypothetical protein [Natronospora cellulosivora (SeqCode)]
MKKDRVYNGFIAGFFASIVPTVINNGAIALDLSTFLWSDYMGLFIMGQEPDGFIQTLFFFAAMYVFMGLLGAIFSFILPYISSQHIFFKGVLFGITTWYILLSIPYILQISGIDHAPFKTVVTHMLSVSLWSIAMVLILKKIDKKIEDINV